MKKIIALTTIWIVAIYFLTVVFNIFLADFYFTRGTNTGSISDLIEATTINPSEETYHRNLGLALAVAAKSEASESNKEQLAQAADNEFKVAINLNKNNLLTLKAAIIGYTELREVSNKYLNDAKDLAGRVRQLSPTDPTVYPLLGV